MSYPEQTCNLDMSTEHPVADVIETCLRRRDFVESLMEASADKRQLTARLDVSRSTVDRGVRDLETRGLVEYDDGEYAITRFGRTVATGFADLSERVAVAERLEPFLRLVPPAFDVDLRHLADATLALSKPSDPHGMINVHVERLRETDDHRLLLPVTGLHAYEVGHRTVVDGGARAESVVTPGVADLYRGDTPYAPLYEEMTGSGRYECRVTERPIPFYLGILDDTVQVGVTKENEPRAILETEDPAVREWAEATYGEFRESADLLGAE